jgi:hypothetical protein
MGAGNYGHEYHGHDHRYDNGNEHYGNYRYHW